MERNHEEFLKNTVRKIKIELDNLEKIQQIKIAEYHVKKKMLLDQLDSVEQHLNK